MAKQKPAAPKPAPAKRASPKRRTTARPSGGTQPGAWSLANRRDPLRAAASAKEREQLEHVLAQEWQCSVAEAKRDDEIELELVDVLDPDDEVRYQLYLWASGSGMAFVADTTDVAAEIVQHTIHATRERAVATSIAEAVRRDGQRVKLREHVVPTVASRGPVAERAAGDTTALDAAIANATQLASAKHPSYSAIQKLFAPWLKPGGKDHWTPYPKKRVDELSSEQRTILEHLAAWGCLHGLHVIGLFSSAAHVQRYLGLAPSGPSDVAISLGGQHVPAWWAISTAAAGHATPKDVLAELARLPVATRQAIVREIVRGECYDLVRAHHTRFKDEGIPRTPARLKHWTTLFELLASLAVSVGEAGAREMAVQLLADLPEYEFGGIMTPTPRTPRVVVALLVLGRVAPPLDAALDARIGELATYCRRDEIFFSKRMLDTIVASVPEARRGALTPRLTSVAGQKFDWV